MSSQSVSHLTRGLHSEPTVDYLALNGTNRSADAKDFKRWYLPVGGQPPAQLCLDVCLCNQEPPGIKTALQPLGIRPTDAVKCDCTTLGKLVANV